MIAQPTTTNAQDRVLDDLIADHDALAVTPLEGRPGWLLVEAIDRAPFPAQGVKTIHRIDPDGMLQ